MAFYYISFSKHQPCLSTPWFSPIFFKVNFARVQFLEKVSFAEISEAGRFEIVFASQSSKFPGKNLLFIAKCFFPSRVAPHPCLVTSPLVLTHVLSFVDDRGGQQAMEVTFLDSFLSFRTCHLPCPSTPVSPAGPPLPHRAKVSRTAREGPLPRTPRRCPPAALARSTCRSSSPSMAGRPSRPFGQAAADPPVRARGHGWGESGPRPMGGGGSGQCVPRIGWCPFSPLV